MDTVTLADGRTLAYAEYGDPDAPPVLFCHGTPGSRHSGVVFDDQPVRVLVPDRPGIGSSDPLPDARTDAPAAFQSWRDDVAAFTDALGVEEYGVVGFSGGAPFALGAAMAPAATGVALVAPAGPPDAQSATALSRLARHAPSVLRGLFAAQRLVVRRRPVAALELLTDADPDSLSLPSDVDPVAAFAEDYLAATAQGGRWPARETALFADPWDMPDPSVPVGVWYGERDENVPPSTARAVADRIANGDEDVVTALQADHLETLCASREEVAAFLDRTA
jgi:pimeloyl-ACP methyl ester carboxylesterase